MGKLDGKAAAITGGSSGMALASPKLFVEEAAYVFITGQKPERIDKASGTYRRHAGLQDALAKANKTVETSYPRPLEFIAQEDWVLLVGTATATVKAAGKPFVDDWVFDVAVRDGKVTRNRESIDTQALAKASAGGKR